MVSNRIVVQGVESILREYEVMAGTKIHLKSIGLQLSNRTGKSIQTNSNYGQMDQLKCLGSLAPASKQERTGITL